MNEKFYSLPKEKQQAIINAGYRVFSQNSYKKSPMQQESVSRFFFTIFKIRKNFICFSGRPAAEFLFLQ